MIRLLVRYEAVVVPLRHIPQNPSHNDDPDNHENCQTGGDVLLGEIAGQIAEDKRRDDSDSESFREMDPVPAPLTAELLGGEQVLAYQVTRLPGGDEVDPVEPHPGLGVAERSELDVIELDDLVVARALVGRNGLSVALSGQSLPLRLIVPTGLFVDHATASGDEVREEVAKSSRDVYYPRADGLEHLGRGRWTEGDEKDEERYATPGEDLLGHPGLSSIFSYAAGAAWNS
jgi:hypothetical protein